ncbi:hypothetical protein [Thiomicrospira pelophila]|uniref:hypothetical protein n=1 Tax=Thiomicrospira pelophila TaxID=934 RepID=UPI0004A72C6D|nr:hypothetical protein [Thiomicrospira pelophila]
MKVSLSSKKVVRSPSGKVVTKPDLANKLVENSRTESHAFIPGGKLEIIDTRYINQLVTPSFWLKRATKRNELEVVKKVLKEIEKAKNNEFFTVIAQQTIQGELGLRVPYQVFDKERLERKNKSRIGGFVLTLYWLVIPIKNLLRKLTAEKHPHRVVAWQWSESSKCKYVNSLVSDFILLTQESEIHKSEKYTIHHAELRHVNGDRVLITTTDLTEYEYKRGRDSSRLLLTESELESTNKPLKKVVELVLGSPSSKVVWLGVTDGQTRQTINLSSLYALTDALAIDLVAQAHQKYILDAIYALPFTPSINIQLLIEVLTLQLVAQDYAVRLLR